MREKWLSFTTNGLKSFTNDNDRSSGERDTPLSLWRNLRKSGGICLVRTHASLFSASLWIPRKHLWQRALKKRNMKYFFFFTQSCLQTRRRGTFFLHMSCYIKKEDAGLFEKNLTYLNTFTFLTVYYIHLPYTPILYTISMKTSFLAMLHY